MQEETQSPKHPLLEWILMRYTRIAAVPIILYLSLHVNKLMDTIEYMTHNLDPSLTIQTQETTISESNTLAQSYNNLTQIMSYMSLGVTVLAFIYASSFTIALIYIKTNPVDRYGHLDSYNIEAYKENVNKLTPILFFILLGAAIVYSKMG